jgi:DNA polymerase elongation subunit (family B)
MSLLDKWNLKKAAATPAAVKKARILLLDIETAPNRVYVWGLWDQNVAINQIEETGYVLCWSAKWLGEEEVIYANVNTETDDRFDMLNQVWSLLAEADIIVHYNGKKFDIPVLNREFIKHGLTPPSPYKQVDLYQEVKKTARFESNKLDFVCDHLGLGRKSHHKGFELWVDCMKGKADSWAIMEEYNKQDVRILEQLYTRMLPWIKVHPNIGALEDRICCPKCGGEDYAQRGEVVAAVLKYIGYCCNTCGGWFRGNKSVSVKRAERMVNVIS